ncbi:hypothetical protein [Frankia sp. AgB32]|uniref:hypothetical protein n=1 Tax=Frankia sp. AgB32 TaxID=631119 RepID=UPI00200BD32C|nr:hypothetical protein [Frankia sp. AgB32]MCK9898316.1 hypothetical protein [Frankia sp. AgB32]
MAGGADDEDGDAEWALQRGLGTGQRSDAAVGGEDADAGGVGIGEEDVAGGEERPVTRIGGTQPS